MNAVKEQEPEDVARSSKRRERKLMTENDIKKIAEDEFERAREIVNIRKELNRLHYKVKTYHNQTRVVNGVVQLVIVVLLLAITYKVFMLEFPAK